MSRQQPLPSAWVARHGARRQYVPKSDARRQWKQLDRRLRYYGMHILGLWPIWIIAFGIVAGLWAAGYRDGLQ